MRSTTDQAKRKALYSQAERIRRDRSVWTMVQGILAPLQFLAFAGLRWFWSCASC